MNKRKQIKHLQLTLRRVTEKLMIAEFMAHHYMLESHMLYNTINEEMLLNIKYQL